MNIVYDRNGIFDVIEIRYASLVRMLGMVFQEVKTLHAGLLLLYNYTNYLE